MEFSVQVDNVTMRCRVFRRSGGYRSGNVCLSGYVGNEQRMECDVTATANTYRNPERFKSEMEKTATTRLRQIAHEYTTDSN